MTRHVPYSIRLTDGTVHEVEAETPHLAALLAAELFGGLANVHSIDRGWRIVGLCTYCGCVVFDEGKWYVGARNNLKCEDCP